jgi:hypothetical protein
MKKSDALVNCGCAAAVQDVVKTTVPSRSVGAACWGCCGPAPGRASRTSSITVVAVPRIIEPPTLDGAYSLARATEPGESEPIRIIASCLDLQEQVGGRRFVSSAD